ncbi:hypothetical protein PHYPSEUDO_006201 [Phytophthora pseudosyringae]|uniref:Uncharacterized protein n=1 Tax=Phytophthora pseudosyringae TaxID=221518 RepID=A0A8T1VJ68_9STRA|nr:hypothetical protein PHYPSEUDO_006201 [Phytophthora pseudosyringae]
MAKNVADETYEAFKARKRKEFDARHAGRAQTTQRQLLRVHLQHFLLTVGATVGRERLRLGEHKHLVSREEKDHTTAGKGNESQSFANEQKRLAVAREAAIAKRHQSAHVIQSFIRRRRHSARIQDAVIENELSSTSVLIPLEIEKPVAPLKAITETLPAAVAIIPVDPHPRATLPPYEIVIELVAARALALGAASIGALDGKYIETELLLKRQSAVVARVVPTWQFVSSLQENSTEIPLQDCSLRFSLDLNNGVRHGLASPESVIDELSATVIVRATGDNGGGNTNTLGVVGIPLSLLETPLATGYALCRWFPMEKAYPGHTARGDLRVSVCYLMRQTSSDSVMMVPYVNTASLKNASDETQVQQERKQPVARRVKKAPIAAVPKRKLAGKSFQQKRAQQEAAGKSEKLKSPLLSLKDALASPVGRISRAEALSPPSSPSSVASSDASENVDSPKTERQVQPSRRFSAPKRQQRDSRPAQSSPSKEEETVEAKANSPGTPPKHFLKRKPYKVVFRKLDWSGVASKTDSNLPSSSNSGQVNSGVGSLPPKSSRSASRASNSSVATSDNGDAGTTFDSAITPKPGAFIDAATARRLAVLETAMYERCGVTRETASLARFKYQAERKKFVTTLQSQSSSEIESCSAASEAAVKELWKRLTGDLSGQIYASTLRGLTAKPIEAIEPVDKKGNFNL